MWHERPMKAELAICISSPTKIVTPACAQLDERATARRTPQPEQICPATPVRRWTPPSTLDQRTLDSAVGYDRPIPSMPISTSSIPPSPRPPPLSFLLPPPSPPPPTPTRPHAPRILLPPTHSFLRDAFIPRLYHPNRGKLAPEGPHRGVGHWEGGVMGFGI